MRSLAADSAKRVVVLVAIAVGALSACIIGPKQDDPASGTPTTDTDTGGGSALDSTTNSGGDSAQEDLETGKTTDSGLGPSVDVGLADTGCVRDGGDGGDGGDAACGDAGSDAMDAGSDAMDGG